MLKKYIEIWNRFRDTIGKDNDFEVIPDDKHIKTKKNPTKMKLKLIFMMMLTTR